MRESACLTVEDRRVLDAEMCVGVYAALNGDEWDAPIDSWHDTHPGRDMLRFNV